MNKGPYSADVVKFARSIGAYSVRGNHDDLVISYAIRAVQGEDIPTRYQYVHELNEEDLDWLIQMPYTITLPSPFDWYEIVL